MQNKTHITGLTFVIVVCIVAAVIGYIVWDNAHEMKVQQSNVSENNQLMPVIQNQNVPSVNSTELGTVIKGTTIPFQFSYNNNIWELQQDKLEVNVDGNGLLSRTNEQGFLTLKSVTGNNKPVFYITAYKLTQDEIKILKSHDTSEICSSLIGGGWPTTSPNQNVEISGYYSVKCDNVQEANTDNQYIVFDGDSNAVVFFFRSRSVWSPLNKPQVLTDYSQYIPDFDAVVHTTKFN